MQWEDPIWSHKATPAGQYGRGGTQKTIDCQPPSRWLSERDRKLNDQKEILGGHWISVYLSLISLFVWELWRGGEKNGEQRETGHVRKKKRLSCIDIAPVNKTTQHIWAKRLRPHICLLMASRVTRWLVAKLCRDPRHQSLFLPWYPSSQ